MFIAYDHQIVVVPAVDGHITSFVNCLSSVLRDGGPRDCKAWMSFLLTPLEFWGAYCVPGLEVLFIECSYVFFANFDVLVEPHTFRVNKVFSRGFQFIFDLDGHVVGVAAG